MKNDFKKAKQFAMENFPVGTMVKIISMKGEEHYTGREGVVRHIDGIGQLHGDWGSLALIPGTDNFVKIG
jgi:hypothetical protein